MTNLATLDADTAPAPPAAPLVMPDQDFGLSSPARVGHAHSARGVRAARAAVFGLALVLTAGFAAELYAIIAFVAVTPLLVTFLVLATLTFAWVALGAAINLAGAFVLAIGRRPSVIELPDLDQAPRSRIALLFPIYHEDPARIAGTIEALAEELRRLGLARTFDAVVLSDSGADAGEREAVVFGTLAVGLAGRPSLYYRRRHINTAKKAGNVRDWIERYGAAYESFVVLDADSIMAADVLARLALALERNPRLALVQTAPALVDGETRFQILQEFAGRMYGDAGAAGIAALHGTDGNYWGHNAIIRTRAFAAAAGLPELPGRAPFGGHIRSHDFVEASLLLRAGWDVAMVPCIEGSYEGAPPDLIAYAGRDRRWAHGNLQHLAIVGRSGLTAMGRLHLAMGAASYLGSLAWAATLVCGLVIAIEGTQLLPRYFGPERQLFPSWPQIDPDAALDLLGATVLVVLLPKLLGLLLRLSRERSAGAALRTTVAVLAETVVSTLIAPILMVAQSKAVVEALAGRDWGWAAQRRDGEPPTFGEAARFCVPYVVCGVVLAVGSAFASLELLMWASPVCLGLVASPLLVWWTARPAGRAFRRFLGRHERLPGIVQRTFDLALRWAARAPA